MRHSFNAHYLEFRNLASNPAIGAEILNEFSPYSHLLKSLSNRSEAVPKRYKPKQLQRSLKNEISSQWRKKRKRISSVSTTNTSRFIYQTLSRLFASLLHRDRTQKTWVRLALTNGHRYLVSRRRARGSVRVRRSCRREVSHLMVRL